MRFLYSMFSSFRCSVASLTDPRSAVDQTSRVPSTTDPTRCPPTCLSMPTRSQHSTSQQYKTCKPTLQHRSRFCQSQQSLQLTKMLPEWEANIRSFNHSSVFQDAQR